MTNEKHAPRIRAEKLPPFQRRTTLAPLKIHSIMNRENDPEGPRNAGNTQSTITYRHLR